jgi:hypothetical protein
MIVPAVLAKQRFLPPADVRCQLTQSIMTDDRDTEGGLTRIVGVSVTIRLDFLNQFLLRVARQAIGDFPAHQPFYGTSAVGRNDTHAARR